MRAWADFSESLTLVIGLFSADLLLKVHSFTTLPMNEGDLPFCHGG